MGCGAYGLDVYHRISNNDWLRYTDTPPVLRCLARLCRGQMPDRVITRSEPGAAIKDPEQLEAA